MSATPTPLGWDEDHLIYQCSDGPHSSWRKTILESPEWEAWDREIARRMRILNRMDDEAARLRILGKQPDERAVRRRAKLKVWDVDECAEAGWMSAAHWEDFVKFLRTKKAIRARHGMEL